MAIKFRNLSSGGGSLPTNPEFESIKANSHICHLPLHILDHISKI